MKMLKEGFYLNLSEILRARFKEGIEERKLFLEHHQTVHDPNTRAASLQAVRRLFWCTSTNFSNSNFKITLNLHLLLFL